MSERNDGVRRRPSVEGADALARGVSHAGGVVRALHWGLGGPATPHPSGEALADYADGRLPAADVPVLERHLERCPDCLRVLHALAWFGEGVQAEAAAVRSPGAGRAPQGVPARPAAWGLALAGAALAVGVLFLAPFSPLRLGSGAGLLRRGSAPGLPPSAEEGLVDGTARVRWNAAGEVQGLDAAPPALRSRLALALRRGSVALPTALQELRTATPSPPAAFTATGPVGEVIRSPRPEFAWELPPGATECLVILYAAHGKEVFRSKAMRDDRWRPKKPFPRGQLLHWQVEARTASGRPLAFSPTRPDLARFRILTASEARALDLDLARLGGSRLLRGLRLLEAGLLGEAEAEFTRLAAANPDSRTAASLYRSVQQLRVRL